MALGDSEDRAASVGRVDSADLAAGLADSVDVDPEVGVPVDRAADPDLADLALAAPANRPPDTTAVEGT